MYRCTFTVWYDEHCPPPKCLLDMKTKLSQEPLYPKAAPDNQDPGTPLTHDNQTQDCLREETHIARLTAYKQRPRAMHRSSHLQDSRGHQRNATLIGPAAGESGPQDWL